MDIKCGNEHTILAQCLAHRKDCYHFFLFIIITIHVIIITITVNQNSRLERALNITKISLLYSWPFKTTVNYISNLGQIRSPRYYLLCKIYLWRNEVTIKALVKLENIVRMQDDIIFYYFLWFRDLCFWYLLFGLFDLGCQTKVFIRDTREL